MRYPDFLPDGGTIGFIAPSFGNSTEPYISMFNNALLKFKGMGYNLLEGPNARCGKGIGKSNTPEACADEINDFFINKRSDVIISCGGGELMCEDLDFVDFEGLKKAVPTWFMGYSDNTNLTFLLPTICDTAAIYAPCAGTFGMEPWHPAIRDAFDLLCGKKLSFSSYDGWESEELKSPENPLIPYNINEKYSQTVAGNRDKAKAFEGRLIGGCLDCLVNLVGTRFDRVKEFNRRYADEGIIWFIESCDLNVMSVRRALWHMENAGWFENVKGFLVGRPYLYNDSFGDFDMNDAVTGILSKYDVPIILGMDLGHRPPMIPMVSGAYAKVTTGENSVTVEHVLK